VHLLAFTPGKGELQPAMVEGRAPSQPDEIALGSVIMRTLGKRIGDTVEASSGRAAQRLRVVGRVIFNNTAFATEEVAPGMGGIVHVELWRRLRPGLPVAPVSFFVRINLERVGYLPGLLAGLVALLALGTVTHALVTSVRRRRRDLAILKTLGFGRGQVSQTVAWQATSFALAAVLVGVPLGVVGGRWVWLVVAEQLGVAVGPVVPPVPLLAIAAGALLAANLAAAGPGWVAARIRPATVLRSG
jgi:ABC-type lipoprotein release transport system permease subunit